jgi:hypothetical protein
MKIEKLGDQFGQYELELKCAGCGHVRRTTPHLLGRICGWDATLEVVASRMRCSSCGRRRCEVRAVEALKRFYAGMRKGAQFQSVRKGAVFAHDV